MEIGQNIDLSFEYWQLPKPCPVYKRMKVNNNFTARLHYNEEEGQGWVLAVKYGFLANVSFIPLTILDRLTLMSKCI